MKLFFEGQTYNTSLLMEWFKDTPFYIKRLRGQHGKSTLECVGYYYNASKGEHCFALPKVFFFKNKPFGTENLEWENGIDVLPRQGRDSRFQDWKIDFLYELPMKLYSAIDFYSKKQESKQIAQESELLEVSSSRDRKNLSLLDITFALRDFYDEHEDLFVFIYKESHKGYSKVNWGRTVRKQTPFVEGDNIIYPLVNNRRKGVNYEEELLILFFNTLRYIDNTFVRINIQDTEYELFSDREFSRMMANGVVVRNLMEIQENYYNETLVELWDLLYKFHSKSHNSGHSGRKEDDYLLVHKFNIVFEDMIDELLHDDDYEFADGRKNDKKQADGKIIDHLFKHTSLLNIDNDVYYVGDSKYYKDGEVPKGTSLYKQYTYAKNIVQSQIDWFYKERPNFCKYIKYRDEKTEGYTITPNFFISGNVEKNSTWKEDELRRTSNIKHETDVTEPEFIEFERHYQFEDRLFDRDTLFLLQYDINFMFVLNAYVSKNKGKNKVFFNKAKQLFRDDFTNYIATQYNFFVLKHKQVPQLYGLPVGTSISIETALGKYFRKLLGKVFCPLEDSDLLILALEKKDSEMFANQQDLITDLSTSFEFYPYKFGDVPSDSLRKILLPQTEYSISEDLFEGISLVPTISQFNGSEILDNSIEEYALVGYYKSEAHLQWIIDNGLYNRRAQMRNTNVIMTLAEIKARLLILHNEGLGNRVYKIKSVAPYLMSKNELPSSEGYHPNREYYMIYDIDTQEESDAIPAQLLETSRFRELSHSFKPVGIKMSELREVTRIIPLHNLRSYLDDHEDVFISMVADSSDIVYGQT